jgi:hypothetical protein
VFRRLNGLSTIQLVEAVDILNDCNVMSTPYQGLRQALNGNRVTPETVWRIERCHHAEAKATHWQLFPSMD